MIFLRLRSQESMVAWGVNSASRRLALYTNAGRRQPERHDAGGQGAGCFDIRPPALHAAGGQEPIAPAFSRAASAVTDAGFWYVAVRFCGFRQHRVRRKPWDATRKPMLLLRLPGSFLFRLAERTFLASLFQLPPRRTRRLNRSPLQPGQVGPLSVESPSASRPADDPIRPPSDWHVHTGQC